MKSETRNRVLQDLVQTVSPSPGREYIPGLEFGVLPLLALFILLFDITTLSWANAAVIVSLCVYAGEIIAAIGCLCLRRLRPPEAGALTTLVLCLFAYIALICYIVLISVGN